MPNKVNGINSESAAASAGITYRQLDHWERKGYIRPLKAGRSITGSGYYREWSEREVGVIERMAELVRLGFIPKAAARIARKTADDETISVRLGPGWILYRGER